MVGVAGEKGWDWGRDWRAVVDRVPTLRPEQMQGTALTATVELSSSYPLQMLSK